MTPEQAMMKLASSTAAAVTEALAVFLPGAVSAPVAQTDTDSPFTDLVFPAVMADVSYVDGVTGGNVLIVPVAGARRIAATMMGADPETADETETDTLDEIEMSAIGEAMNQMMSAAAMATSAVLDEEVEIAPPDVRLVTGLSEVLERWEHHGRSATIRFSAAGAPCTLVQLIPNAFVVRMTRAFDEQTASYAGTVPLSDLLGDIPVRVWAELGRARMPSMELLTKPLGSLLELNREANEPIDLYADGMLIAQGRLVIDDEGGLQIRIESLHPQDTGDRNLG